MAIFDLFGKSESRAVGGSDPALKAWGRGDDLDLYRSNGTHSGQVVNEDTSLGLSTLYSCIAIRSEALASMPVHSYMTEDEKRVRTPAPHWMSRPNPEEDWPAYISAASWSLDLHGNLYEVIVRDRSNRVRELWQLDPATVDVTREAPGQPLTYRVDGQIFKGEIRHRWFHRRPGDVIGSSPIAFAQEAIGLGLSAQQFGAEFFGAGGVPQGVVTIPGAATKEQLVETKGEFTKKSRLPKVLQGGMTYEATSVSPNESQFLESRRFSAAEICAIYRVPPEFVAVGVEGSSLLYQNVSSSWLAFIRRALMAPMQILETSYSELLPVGHRFRFVPDVYLKPDTGARFDAYKVAVEGGWMTPNEVRRLEDRDDVEFGDTLYAPKKETAESVQAPAEDEAVPEEGADVIPFGERADRSSEARHGSHNQKDHGRGKGGGSAANVARQGLPASDFDGPVVARTIGMSLSSAQMEALKPASNMDEYQEQYDKGGLARHAAVGEQIVKDAASFKGHDGIEATSGIGRSWTTEPGKIEHLMAVQPGQTEVRITAKPRTSDIIASNVKGNEFGLESQGDMASGESEVRLKGGSPVDIVNVQVRNPYQGEKWLTVWDSAEQRHGSHNQKDHGRKNGVSGLARTIAEPDGGFTANLGGTPIGSGWSVAQAGSTTPIKASEFIDNPRAAKKAIADKIHNAPSDMDGIGGWHEPETGIVHLDYVKVLPSGQKAAAIQMGKDQNQLSIANLDAITAGDWDNAIVNTGGSGDLRGGIIPVYGETTGHLSTPAEEAERRRGRGTGREDLRGDAGETNELIALLARIESRHGDHDQKTHGRKTAGGSGGQGRRLDPEALTGEGAYFAGSSAPDVKAMGAIEAASHLSKAERQAVADELNAQPLIGDVANDLGIVGSGVAVDYGMSAVDLNNSRQPGTPEFEELPLGVRLQLQEADANPDTKMSPLLEAIDAYQGVGGAVGVNGTSVQGDIRILSAEIENATGVSPASAMISAINRRWAWSSQSIASEAMQLEVAEARGESTFKMKFVTGQGEIIYKAAGKATEMNVPDSMGWLPTGSLQAAHNFRSAIPTSVKSVRLATERRTAAVMKESGISPNDTVTLYRGANGGTITQLFPQDAAALASSLSGGSGKRSTEIVTNPLSSWSESRQTAEQFGGTIIKVEVPASQIYGVSAWSGHGSLAEREVILYDDPGNFSDYAVEGRAKTERINLDEFDADWIKQVGQGDIAFTAEELRHGSHNQKDHGRRGPTAAFTGMDSVGPATQAAIVKSVAKTWGVSEPEARAIAVANLVKAAESGNLSDRAWYQNEHDNLEAATKAINDKYGTSFTTDQMIGAVSVTSARQKWGRNKEIAQTILEKTAADEPFNLSADDISDYNTWATKRKAGLAEPHPDLQPGTYRPSELPADIAASKGGMPGVMNTDWTISAVKIARGESTLEEAVRGPKQRSFVNNLSDPKSAENVTNDTWHYEAMSGDHQFTRSTKRTGGTSEVESHTMSEWGSDTVMTKSGTKSPQDFFQSSPSVKKEGYGSNQGHYPWVVDVTKQATTAFNDKHGTDLIPSEFQAIAWKAVGGDV